jgi:hopanoid-associated phosphorylase
MRLLHEGTLLKHSGIGPARAREAAEALLEAGCTSLVSWGSAVGLSPDLAPGSLVIPEKIHSSEGVSFTPDASWCDRLTTRLRGHLPLFTGPMAESSAILKTPEEKKLFFEKSGALALDMESAGAAQLALEKGIPFISLRAIVDPWDMPLPPCAAGATDGMGKIRPLYLFGSLLIRPWEIFPLLRLARYYRAALDNLSSAVRLAGPRLLSPGRPTHP